MRKWQKTVSCTVRLVGGFFKDFNCSTIVCLEIQQPCDKAANGFPFHAETKNSKIQEKSPKRLGLKRRQFSPDDGMTLLKKFWNYCLFHDIV